MKDKTWESEEREPSMVGGEIRPKEARLDVIRLSPQLELEGEVRA